MCCLFAVIFLQIWPHVRYHDPHTNKSQNLHTPVHIITEYFIDKKKYVFLIMLHGQTAFFIGVLAMIATGTMLIAFLEHTCGMFSIAR